MSKFITVQNLSKFVINNNTDSDKEKCVFRNVSFQIKKGEFVTLFGPNGCGKSTLLQCLAGLSSPTRGHIQVAGSSPDEVSIGFVFQNYRDALLPWRTCIDNIGFPLELAGVSEGRKEELVESLVTSLGLNVDLAVYPRQQSGGQQQLVAIARALISNPSVLVMDEPLSALDINARLSMRKTIERIWLKTGITTIYVSHDVDEAVYLSDRIFVLSESPGTIVKEIINELPHPRLEFLDSLRFNELRADVLAAFEKNKQTEA